MAEIPLKRHKSSIQPTKFKFKIVACLGDLNLLNSLNFSVLNYTNLLLSPLQQVNKTSINTVMFLSIEGTRKKEIDLQESREICEGISCQGAGQHPYDEAGQESRKLLCSWWAQAGLCHEDSRVGIKHETSMFLISLDTCSQDLPFVMWIEGLVAKVGIYCLGIRENFGLWDWETLSHFSKKSLNLTLWETFSMNYLVKLTRYERFIHCSRKSE